MTEWTLRLALAWHALLILVLLLYALRARDLVTRVIAFDALSILFVAALVLLALLRQRPYYLDIALVLAMLGFVQTVAAARLLERDEQLQ